MTRVGFIGLGSQGGGMAERLIRSGLHTTLWARRDASLTRFRETPASFAETPAELGAASDLVGVCVVDDAGVLEVLLGESGALAGMRPGGIVAIHSTISLDVCCTIADAAAAKGVEVLDAPVSGGGYAALEGQLTVLVGGAEKTYAKALPTLETLGGNVFHLRPLGSGLIAKLVNNTLHAAHYALAEDAIKAGSELGLDPEVLGHALAVSSGNSYSLSAAVMVGGFEAIAPMVGPLLRKDVTIFDGLTSERGVVPGSLVPVAKQALMRFGQSHHP